MPLRGVKPESRKQRLKLLLSGEAGVGKTKAGLQMPKPYIIDTEKGTTEYAKEITKTGGLVFPPDGIAVTIDEVITEVRTLMSEEHPFITLDIDPITPLYYQAVDEGQAKVGTEFGKHVEYANKKWRRLFYLLTQIDMNVIVTAHEKNEYGPGQLLVGKTFDGFKKLDYLFDLWLILERDPKEKNNRIAYVRKTRLEAFPDQSRFNWNYGELVARIGQERLEKGIQPVIFASPEQVEEFKFLLSKLSEQEQKNLKIDKVMAEYEDLSDMPRDRIEKGIALLSSYKRMAIAA